MPHMNALTIAAMALFITAPLALAQTTSPQVPNPANPAPENPKATNGMSTEAPAKDGAMMKSDKQMMNKGEMSSDHKTMPKQ